LRAPALSAVVAAASVAVKSQPAIFRDTKNATSVREACAVRRT
jgi:hypothetical protein